MAALRTAVVESFLRALSWGVRQLPFNKRVQPYFITWSLRFESSPLRFRFRCRPSGVLWLAGGFPDLLTRHMLFEGMYQQDVLIALRRTAPPGGVVYDVGGHHGLMAVVASQAVGPSGRVVSFEPNPQARRFMERHLELNHAGNVRVEPLALSDRNGEFPFYVQTGRTTWNSSLIGDFVEPGARGETLMVPASTLDAYVGRSGLIPAVVKIDTEGSEMLVLKGAMDTIRKHRPVFLMEFNPKSATSAGTTVAAMVSFFRAQSYRLFILGRDFRGYYRYKDQRPFEETLHTRNDSLVNVICEPETGSKSLEHQ